MSTRPERRIGRPNVAESFRPFVEENLATDPNAPTRELLNRARRVGYQGGKTAFYGLVASARHGFDARAPSELPGESAHHDIGEIDGMHFLVSRLGYSGWTEASVLERPDVESLARTMLLHYAAFGGVPFLARFECREPAADSVDAGGEVISWNLAMTYFAAEVGIGLSLSRERSLAARIQEQLQGRVFRDSAELGDKLASLCEAQNTQMPADPASGSATPATLMVEERRRLRSIPVSASELELREPIFIDPGGTVVHRAGVFSVPSEASGRMGTLLLGRDRVRIVADGVDVVHPRH